MQVLPSSLTTFPWVTTVVVLGSLAWYAYAQTRRIPEQRLMLTFARTVSKGELWLPCLAALSHADTVHLLLDLTVLASLYLAEMSLGTPRYAEACAEVFVLTVSIQLFVHWSLIRCLYGRRAVELAIYHTQRSLGSTSYAIGLLVMYAQQEDYFEFLLYKGLRVHASNAPLFVYILATCLARDASLLGHGAAGITGWLVGSGGLAFLDGYWFSCLMVWLGVALLVSLKETTFLKTYLGCVQVKSWPPWEDRVQRGNEGEGEGTSTGSEIINDDDDEAAAAREAGTRREPPLRTIVNDEPYVQWVAATRLSLALSRDQAEVDAAESKESTSSSDDKSTRKEDGGQGVEMAEMSTVDEIPFSGSEDETSEDSEHEEADLLGRNAGRGVGGETKRRSYSSRARRAFANLRRHGRRRRGTRGGAGGSKHRADLLDDLV